MSFSASIVKFVTKLAQGSNIFMWTMMVSLLTSHFSGTSKEACGHEKQRRGRVDATAKEAERKSSIADDLDSHVRRNELLSVTHVTNRQFKCKLEIRSVDWYLPQPRPRWTNCSYNYGRMHGACTKRPYFHFRSKIWRYHRVSCPRFPKGRENFGDSRTFKADIGLLNICTGFQDLLA